MRNLKVKKTNDLSEIGNIINLSDPSSFDTHTLPKSKVKKNIEVKIEIEKEFFINETLATESISPSFNNGNVVAEKIITRKEDACLSSEENTIDLPSTSIMSKQNTSTANETQYSSKEQEEYQEQWKINKFNHRKMVSKKNRKWLLENSENSSFKEQDEHPEIYNKIKDLFDNESTRKWMIHIICNFIPLTKLNQVPKIPTEKKNCPFSGLPLTDIKHIIVGDRDKHIAFTGERTDVIISAIAVQELHRFVMNHTYDFDSRNGHIINHCLDEMRNK